MMINKNKRKKILKPEYMIVLVIILTIIYFVSSPYHFYKDGELYHTQFTRLKSAQLGIVNIHNTNEYFIAQRASCGFYAEFHTFDGTIQAIKEVTGEVVRNVGHPFCTSLWIDDKAYFSALKLPEDLVIWEVDFVTKKTTLHYVKKLNILQSLQDTTIAINGITFFKPRMNIQNDKDIELSYDGSGYRLLFSETLGDSIYSYFNYELLEDNTAYQKVKEYLNKHLKPDKDFSVYDVFEIISFFNRRNFYFRKYFANINPPCAPVSHIYLLDSFDANEDGNKDLLIRVCHNRFYNDILVCYDLQNERILWERNDFHNVKNVQIVDLDNDGKSEILFSTYAPCNEIPINFHEIESKYRNRSYFGILNTHDGSIKKINNKPALIESARGFYEFRFILLEKSNKILMGLMARSDFDPKKLLLYDYVINSLDTLDIEYRNLLGFTKENGKIVAFDNPLNLLRSVTLGSDLKLLSDKTAKVNQGKLVCLLPSFIDIDTKKYNLLFAAGQFVIDNSLRPIAEFNQRFRDFTAQSLDDNLYFIDYTDDNYFFSRIEFIRNKTINPIMINIMVVELIILLVFLLLKQSFQIPLLPSKNNYFIIQRFFGVLYIWRLTGVYHKLFKLPRRISMSKRTPYKYLHDFSDKIQDSYTYTSFFVKTKIYKIHKENELSIIQRISHDLKTQIMMIKLKLDEYYDQLKNDHNKEIGSVLNTIKDISQIAQTLSNFSQINKIYKENVDIIELIEEILAELHNHENRKQLHFFTQDKLIISADRKLLKTALKNLITNALDAVTEKQEIEVSLHRVDHVMSIIIKNGTTIRSEEFDKVEELGYTTKRFGSGLGIPISRSIIEKHDGKFQLLLEDGYFIVEIYLPYNE